MPPTRGPRPPRLSASEDLRLQSPSLGRPRCCVPATCPAARRPCGRRVLRLTPQPAPPLPQLCAPEASVHRLRGAPTVPGTWRGLGSHLPAGLLCGEPPGRPRGSSFSLHLNTGPSCRCQKPPLPPAQHCSLPQRPPCPQGPAPHGGGRTAGAALSPGRTLSAGHLLGAKPPPPPQDLAACLVRFCTNHLCHPRAGGPRAGQPSLLGSLSV